MSRGFNLTAQINLQGPSNIRAVVSSIRQQLGNINTNVNVTINPATNRNLANINNQIVALNNNLTRTTNIANNATGALNNMAAALGRMNTNVQAIPRNINNVNAAATATNTTLNNTRNTTRQVTSEFEAFGRQSALAVRRFLAFATVTGVMFKISNAVNKATKDFIDFDRELVRVAQVTGSSRQELGLLVKEITRVSTTFGVLSSDLIGVSRTLSQAGLTARETERAIEALAKASVAPSFDDLNKTVEGSIALMRQFNIGTKDLEKALGSINAVAAKFAVEASDIVVAIQRTGGVFAAASKGVSSGTDALNEFISVFTSVRATTRESAETIATGLRTIFARIQRGSTIESLKEFGVVLTDLEGKFVGPFEAVKRLSEGLSSLDPRSLDFSRIVEELGGFRQIGKVIPLIQQFAVAQEALKVAQTGQDSLAINAAQAQDALAIKILKVKEEFTALIRSIGESKGFKDLVNLSLDLASALIKISDALKPILPALTAITAVKGVSALLQFGRGFGSGLRTQTQNLGGPVLRFARGGMVPGTGSGFEDNVPALLSRGEFVMSKKAVDNIGAGNLARMNSKKYNLGGETTVGAVVPKVLSGGNDIISGKETVLVSPGSGKGVAGSDTVVGSKLGYGVLSKSIYHQYALTGQGGSSENKVSPNELYQIAREVIAGGQNSKNFDTRIHGVDKEQQNNFETILKNQMKQAISNGAIEWSTLVHVPLQSEEIKFDSKYEVPKGVAGSYFESIVNAFAGRPVVEEASEDQRPFDFTSGLRGEANRVLFSKLLDLKYVDAKNSETKAKQDFNKKIKNQLALDNYAAIEQRVIAAYNAKKTQQAQNQQNTAKKSLGGIIQKYATGGLVPGVGNTDSVPMVLPEGSYVIRKSSTKKIGTQALSSLSKHNLGGSTKGVNTLLTPGEWVFSPEEAENIGASSLNRMNKFGKFASGGSVGSVQRLNTGGGPTSASATIATMNSAHAQLGTLLGRNVSTSVSATIATMNSVNTQLGTLLAGTVKLNKAQTTLKQRMLSLANSMVNRVGGKATFDKIGKRAAGFGNFMGGYGSMALAMGGGAFTDYYSKQAGGQDTAEGRRRSAVGSSYTNAISTGAMTGAMMGSIFGPVGTGFGAAVGMVVGGIYAWNTSLKESEKVVKEFNLEMAQKDLAASSEESAEKLAKFNKVAEGVGRRNTIPLEESRREFFNSLVKTAIDEEKLLGESRDKKPGETEKQFIDRLASTQKAAADQSMQYLQMEMQRGGETSSQVLSKLSPSDRRLLIKQIAEGDKEYQSFVRSRTAELGGRTPDQWSAADQADLARREEALVAARMRSMDALQELKKEEEARAEAFRQAAYEARQVVTSLEQTISAIDASNRAVAFFVEQGNKEIEAIINDKTRSSSSRMVEENIAILSNPSRYSERDRRAALEQGSMGLGVDAGVMSRLVEFGVSGKQTLVNAAVNAIKDEERDPDIVSGRILSSIEGQIRSVFGNNAVGTILTDEARKSIENAVRNKKDGEQLTDADIQEIIDGISGLNGMFEAANNAGQAFIQRLQQIGNVQDAYAAQIENYINLDNKIQDRRANVIATLANVQNDIKKTLKQNLTIEERARPDLEKISVKTGIDRNQLNLNNLISNVNNLMRQREALIGQSQRPGTINDPVAAARIQGRIQEFDNAINRAKESIEDWSDTLKSSINDAMSDLSEAVSKFESRQQKSAEMLENIVTGTPDDMFNMYNSFDTMSKALTGTLETIDFNPQAIRAFYTTLQSSRNVFDAQQAAQIAYAQELQSALRLFDNLAVLQGMGDPQKNAMKANMLQNMAITRGFMTPFVAQLIQNLRANKETDPEVLRMKKIIETLASEYEQAQIVISTDMLNKQTEIFKKANDNLVNQIAELIKSFNQAIEPLVRMGITRPGMVPERVFSTGGLIYASTGQLVNYQPRGTDTVPAMLTPGEFVVNRAATQRNLPLLQSINSGANGYNKGGVVYLANGSKEPVAQNRAWLGDHLVNNQSLAGRIVDVNNNKEPLIQTVSGARIRIDNYTWNKKATPEDRKALLLFLNPSLPKKQTKPLNQKPTIPIPAIEIPQQSNAKAEIKRSTMPVTKDVDTPMNLSRSTEPLRKWHDSTGKHATVGVLVGRTLNSVHIRKANGQLVNVVTKRLSEYDQKYVTAAAARFPIKPSPARTQEATPTPITAPPPIPLPSTRTKQAATPTPITAPPPAQATPVPPPVRTQAATPAPITAPPPAQATPVPPPVRTQEATPAPITAPPPVPVSPQAWGGGHNWTGQLVPSGPPYIDKTPKGAGYIDYLRKWYGGGGLFPSDMGKKEFLDETTLMWAGRISGVTALIAGAAAAAVAAASGSAASGAVGVTKSSIDAIGSILTAAYRDGASRPQLEAIAKSLYGIGTSKGGSSILMNLLEKLYSLATPLNLMGVTWAGVATLQGGLGESLGIGKPGSWLNTAGNNLWSWLGQPSSKKKPTEKQKGGIVYASTGQLINFEPRGTDTVPAMLTPGEFVVNRAATQKNLPLLKAINNGTQAYNTGGIVYAQDGGFIGLSEDQLKILEAASVSPQIITEFGMPDVLDVISSKNTASSLDDFLSDLAAKKEFEMMRKRFDDPTLRTIGGFPENFNPKDIGEIINPTAALASLVREFVPMVAAGAGGTAAGTFLMQASPVSGPAMPVVTAIGGIITAIGLYMTARAAQAELIEKNIKTAEGTLKDSLDMMAVENPASTAVGAGASGILTGGIPQVGMSGLKMGLTSGGISASLILGKNLAMNQDLDTADFIDLATSLIPGGSAANVGDNLLKTVSAATASLPFVAATKNADSASVLFAKFKKFFGFGKISDNVVQQMSPSQYWMRKNGYISGPYTPEMIAKEYIYAQISRFNTITPFYPGDEIKFGQITNKDPSLLQRQWSEIHKNPSVIKSRKILTDAAYQNRYGVDDRARKILEEIDDDIYIRRSSSRSQSSVPPPPPPPGGTNRQQQTPPPGGSTGSQQRTSSSQQQRKQQTETPRKPKRTANLEEAYRFFGISDLPKKPEDLAKIKKIYLSMMMKHHPDRGGDVAMSKLINNHRSIINKELSVLGYETFSRGGVVYASKGQLINFEPRGTDIVPAMLTPGEFVVNRASTQKHLPLLQSINSGSNVVYAQQGGQMPPARKQKKPYIIELLEAETQNSPENFYLLSGKTGKISITNRLLNDFKTEHDKRGLIGEKLNLVFDYLTSSELEKEHLTKKIWLANTTKALPRLNDHWKKEVIPGHWPTSWGTLLRVQKRALQDNLEQEESFFFRTLPAYKRMHARAYYNATNMPYVYGEPIYANKGRLISYQPKGTDIVPAMLTPGEFVVNRKATSDNINLLHRINNNEPVYATDGGQVATSTKIDNKTSAATSFNKNTLIIRIESKNSPTENRPQNNIGVLDTSGLEQFVAKFDHFANKLANLSLPTTFTHNHNINVNLTGADVLSKLLIENGPLARFVVEKVNTKLLELDRSTEGAFRIA